MNDDTRRTVRGAAVGFLLAGPLGAAGGALLGSRPKRDPGPPPSLKAEWAAAGVLMGAFAVALLLGIAWFNGWLGY